MSLATDVPFTSKDTATLPGSATTFLQAMVKRLVPDWLTAVLVPESRIALYVLVDPMSCHSPVLYTKN